MMMGRSMLDGLEIAGDVIANDLVFDLRPLSLGLEERMDLIGASAVTRLIHGHF